MARRATTYGPREEVRYQPIENRQLTEDEYREFLSRIPKKGERTRSKEPRQQLTREEEAAILMAGFKDGSKRPVLDPRVGKSLQTGLPPVNHFRFDNEGNMIQPYQKKKQTRFGDMPAPPTAPQTPATPLIGNVGEFYSEEQYNPVTNRSAVDLGEILQSDVFNDRVDEGKAAEAESKALNYEDLIFAREKARRQNFTPIGTANSGVYYANDLKKDPYGRMDPEEVLNRYGNYMQWPGNDEEDQDNFAKSIRRRDAQTDIQTRLDPAIMDAAYNDEFAKNTGYGESLSYLSEMMMGNLMTRNMELIKNTPGYHASITKTESKILDAIKAFSTKKIPTFRHLTKRWETLNWNRIIRKFRGGMLDSSEFVGELLGGINRSIIQKMTFIYAWIGRCYVVRQFDSDKVIDELFVFPYVYEDLMKMIREIYKLLLSAQQLHRRDGADGSLLFNFVKNVYIQEGEQPIELYSLSDVSGQELYNRKRTNMDRMEDSVVKLDNDKVPLKKLSLYIIAHLSNLMEQALLMLASIHPFADSVPTSEFGNSLDVNIEVLMEELDSSLMMYDDQKDKLAVLRILSNDHLARQKKEFSFMDKYSMSKFSAMSSDEVTDESHIIQYFEVIKNYQALFDSLIVNNEYVAAMAGDLNGDKGEAMKAAFEASTSMGHITINNKTEKIMLESKNGTDYNTIISSGTLLHAQGFKFQKNTVTFPSAKERSMFINMDNENSTIYKIEQIIPGFPVYAISNPFTSEIDNYKNFLNESFLKYQTAFIPKHKSLIKSVLFSRKMIPVAKCKLRKYLDTLVAGDFAGNFTAVLRQCVDNLMADMTDIIAKLSNKPNKHQIINLINKYNGFEANTLFESEDIIQSKYNHIHFVISDVNYAQIARKICDSLNNEVKHDMKLPGKDFALIHEGIQSDQFSEYFWEIVKRSISVISNPNVQTFLINKLPHKTLIKAAMAINSLKAYVNPLFQNNAFAAMAVYKIQMCSKLLSVAKLPFYFINKDGNYELLYRTKSELFHAFQAVVYSGAGQNRITGLEMENARLVMYTREGMNQYISWRSRVKRYMSKIYEDNVDNTAFRKLTTSQQLDYIRTEAYKSASKEFDLTKKAYGVTTDTERLKEINAAILVKDRKRKKPTLKEKVLKKAEKQRAKRRRRVEETDEEQKEDVEMPEDQQDEAKKNM